MCCPCQSLTHHWSNNGNGSSRTQWGSTGEGWVVMLTIHQPHAFDNYLWLEANNRICINVEAPCSCAEVMNRGTHLRDRPSLAWRLGRPPMARRLKTVAMGGPKNCFGQCAQPTERICCFSLHRARIRLAWAKACEDTSTRNTHGKKTKKFANHLCKMFTQKSPIGWTLLRLRATSWWADNKEESMQNTIEQWNHPSSAEALPIPMVLPT